MPHCHQTPDSYPECDGPWECGKQQFCGIQCWTGFCSEDGDVPAGTSGQYCQPCDECTRNTDSVYGNCNHLCPPGANLRRIARILPCLGCWCCTGAANHSFYLPTNLTTTSSTSSVRQTSVDNPRYVFEWYCGHVSGWPGLVMCQLCN